MPSVPVYNSTQVADKPIEPSVSRPTPGSGIGEVVRGMNHLGNAVDAIVEDAYKKASVSDVSKAKAELEKEATKLYYDSTSGAFNQHGEAGVLAPDSAYTNLSKKRSELLNSLNHNPLAQQLFDMDSTKTLESYNRRGQSHQATERRVVAAANIDTLHKTSLNSLPFAYNDPLERERLTKIGDEAIRQLAPNKEAADAAIFEAHKDAHKTVVKAYLDHEDVDGAEAYFKDNKKAFGDDSHQVEKVLLVAGRNKKADIASENIVNASLGDNAWADAEKALKVVDTLNVEQGLKDEIRQRVSIRLNQNALQKKKDIETVYDRVAGSYEKSGYGKWSKSDEAWLKQYDPDAWYKLRMRMRGDSEYYRRLRDGKQPESPDQVDAYARARADMIRNADKWATTNPPEIRHEWFNQLSPGGYKHLMEKDWPAHLQRMSSGLVNMPMVKRMVESAITRSHIEEPDDAEYSEDGIAMRNYVNDYIDDHIATKGTRLTGKDILEGIDFAQIRMREEGRWKDGYRFTWHTNLKNEMQGSDDEALLNPPDEEPLPNQSIQGSTETTGTFDEKRISALQDQGYSDEEILQMVNSEGGQ